MRFRPPFIFILLFALPVFALAEPAPTTSHSVEMTTSLGKITLLLDTEMAPVSVANFLKYVDEGYYSGSLFHRVIKGFMIQAGGFDEQMKRKEVHTPIDNEATNGLKNLRGTIAMARTNVINSATAQFFINVTDNASLDHSPTSYGYAVFGRVVEGMSVVEQIENVATHRFAGMADVPVEPVVIISMQRVE